MASNIPGIPTTSAAKQSTDLITALTTGVSFDVPAVDFTSSEYQIPGGANNPMYQTINHITPSDVTERKVSGTGAFDAFMEGIMVHLRAEYDAGRITGAEYTKAYIAAIGTAMGSAVQFALGKDQVFWAGINSQIAAITAKVNLGIAKVQYAKLVLEAHTAKAQYALTAIQVGVQDNQIAVLREQIEANAAQTTDTRTDGTPVGGLLGKQKDQITQQIAFVKEQIETQRAQTMDVRTTGDAISGSVGKQKELYSQQIASYKRDAEAKAAKLIMDLWITMKTTEPGTPSPSGIAASSLDSLISRLRDANQIQ